MQLTAEQQAMLAGEQGRATEKAMQILTTLGKIYCADRLIPATSVQIAGVSYDNLGEAGLKFLQEMADGSGKTKVLTTLNPAGMDVENWQALGINEGFALNQQRVLDAFARMDVITTCSCTPYLVGNTPLFGEHIAWSESSAVCYANSVLGSRSNREGGPSALAAALTAYTPEYGYHLDEQRQPTVHVTVHADLIETPNFGALGKAIADKLAGQAPQVPYITGVANASLEQLKSLCASIATYAGTALFHMRGITPEAGLHDTPEKRIKITQNDIERALQQMNDAAIGEIDFVSLGCPHLSIKEIARIAELVKGKRVTKEFWITTARPTKAMADRMGYTATIEASGAKFAADTCCVVAPIKGRFKGLATDSAKACYYAYAKNKLKTRLIPFEQVVQEALR